MGGGNGYPCARCGRVNQSWETFETGWPDRVSTWCLHHIPWWPRFKMRLKGTN